MMGLALREFIVPNPHIFTEEEALMCTEGSDKCGGSHANHGDIFHELVIAEELRFVASEWSGKRLYVCLRVAQGEMPTKYHCCKLLKSNLTCFLFLFMQQPCSPGAWHILSWPKPDFLPFFQKSLNRVSCCFKVKTPSFNPYKRHLAGQGSRN